MNPTNINDINAITEAIIGAAIDVHRHLGPGLLESVYEACVVYELAERGLSFEAQKHLPIVYRGIIMGKCDFCIDLFVEGRVVVELKAVERILPIHEAQLMTYLRLSQCSTGLLLNFNVLMMKDGIKRRVLETMYLEAVSGPTRDGSMGIPTAE